MNILGCRFGAPARLVSMSIAALALAACGGGGGGGGGSASTTPPPAATTYTIGGAVTGLSGTLVLQDNGGNNLTVTTAGNFTFSTQLASGAAYSVTVLTQPSGQTCTVANGSGTASANVTNVAVTCASSSSGVTIGGTVTGLTGTGLVLQDNGADNLTITKTGSFTFATALASGTAYAVTVSTQPTSPSQTCTVTSGTGTTASTNVTGVTVNCSSVGKFAYTASNSGNEIYAYTISSTTGALTSVGNPYPEGTAPAAVSLSPNGMFAFSATNDGKEIYAFTIDQSSGALTPVPNSPFSTGFATGSTYPDIAVSPNSQYLYLASAGDGKVAGFSIDQTSGALATLAGSPYTAGAGASGIPAFSPNGNFLYVVNNADNTVSGWSIGSNGVLTSVGANVSTGGADPVWITFTPNGNFAYVSNNGGDSIAAYSVDTTTGVLTALATPTYGVSESPEDLTINSAGTYLYVPMGTGSSPGGIQVYSISSAGALAAVGPLNQVGIKPLFVDIDPSGQFAYTTSAGTGGTGVYGFSISSTTGELTALTGSPYATGPAGSGTAAQPQFITIDPSGQFGYTADEGTGTITGFTINQTTGVLTQVPGSPYTVAGGTPFFVSISPEAPGIRD
jgi:6-phosphogluconolactonase (cycloisomerase 2 family)